MSEPDANTLVAFEIQDALQSIVGGRGSCLRAGEVILKPSDNDQESQWTAQLVNQMPTSPDYRLARPITANIEPESFVYNGWTASQFLAGEAGPKGRFSALFKASRAFHMDIASLDVQKPDFLRQRTNRWHEADLVVWSEKPLDAVSNINNEILIHFERVLSQLEELKQPLPESLPSQVIHGDLTGNVLFAEGLAPGIIDITPYWRPARYADAIVVADCLIWHGEGQELIEMFSIDVTDVQLLLRAVLWRCLTFAIDSDMEFVNEHIAKADFQNAVNWIRKLVKV